VVTDRSKRIFSFVVLFAIALGGICAFWLREAASPVLLKENDSSSYKTPLPNVLLMDANGNELSLASLLENTLREEKTKRAILSFWATWCPPCLKEIPELSKKRDEYRRAGTSIVLISFDKAFLADERAKVAAWLSGYKVELTNVFDFKEKLIEELNLAALPFNALVDENLNILWASEGVLNFEAVEKSFHARQAE
jgi:thiol-disulfide isomerase/thioredoxin